MSVEKKDLTAEFDEAIAKQIPILVPVLPVLELFMCPICLSTLTDTYTSVCGHSFCEKCISECVDRRHQCPLCLQELTEKQLAKNLLVDNLLQRLVEEKEKATKDYVDNVVSKAVGEKGLDSNRSPTHEPSPIERIYKSKTSQTLIAYEGYFRNLVAEMTKRKANLRAAYTEKVNEIRSRVNLQMQLSESLDSDGLAVPTLIRTQSQEEAVAEIQGVVQEFQGKVKEIDERHLYNVSQLEKNFEEHMSKLAPSPFLLPILVTISVEGFRQRLDLSLTSSDDVESIKEMVIQRTKGLHEEIKSFSPNTVLYIHRSPDMKEEVRNRRMTIYEMKLPQGCQLSLVGGSKEEKESVCFSLSYVGGDQRVDYFRCNTCRLNWICASCARSCHSDHKLVMFMQNHKPSYGCCYCMKKGKCMIDNARKSRKKSKKH